MAKSTERGKHVVVVSREWNNPKIQISVTNVRIAIAMELPAFLNAIAAELEEVKGVTKAQLKKRIAAAAEVVCTKMKRETTQVM